MGAKTWVHFDVREYDQIYLKDDFFCKTSKELNRESLISLAKKYQLPQLCSCSIKDIAFIKESATDNNLISKCPSCKALSKLYLGSQR